MPTADVFERSVSERKVMSIRNYIGMRRRSGLCLESNINLYVSKRIVCTSHIESWHSSTLISVNPLLRSHTVADDSVVFLTTIPSKLGSRQRRPLVCHMWEQTNLDTFT